MGIKKSDNPDRIGKHVFEVSGCGKYPFKFAGYYMKHGTCDHCGTGIYHNFVVRDAEGKTFKVGCVCIDKTGDYGLIHAYKNSPEFRAMKKEKAAAKDAALMAEFKALIEANKAKLEAMPLKKYDGSESNHYEHISWVYGRCGASGRARWLKNLKNLVK